MNLEVLSQKKKLNSNKAPLIFVHGAGGGAWYFEFFLEYFAQRGFDSYALSLRGHGNSDGHEQIDTFGLDDYLKDVKSVVDSLDEKPILIGHSMGGAIVQKYLSLHQDDLSSVILLASAQVGGIDEDSNLGLFFSDSRNFLRKIRSAHPSEHLSLEKIMNDNIFSSRFSKEELKIIRKKLTKESNRVKKDLLKPFMTGQEVINIPIHVIGSYGDHMVTPDITIKNAQAFNVEPIFIKDLCHFMTIDPEWEVAADAIDKCLEKK